ncbi:MULTISPECIES: hypothetical protein [unclassified Exiguobacterium]|uniref:hypothetical protein n=1 Tax=unclassified Exiguobacterium TaxID=2644629 RepID=UPI0010388AFA|nr:MULTISPECIES: hypothetical protein [unclassified Exiguobacterium]TCI27233.1 hypothetical protein EVJ32_03300 [Exiguobacterium sp. SH5S4]TCI51430.1 hypothetical protein EVJ30_11230 [Exiguobacterium sp. SH5S13]TCI63910.1 hypothetical protein EVJ26_05820 [Exiguobacterium sp. SH3S1]
MKKLKVGELRAELKRFTQDELIELVVGLYKQHNDVKTTLNRYFNEGFEQEEVHRLVDAIQKLAEPNPRNLFKFTQLREGAKFVKEATAFTDPVATNVVRVFYLNYFVEYVERQADVIHSVAPGELNAYFTEFDKLMKTLQTEPELVVFGLTEEVDHLFEHVPAEDKAVLLKWWERKKRQLNET